MITQIQIRRGLAAEWVAANTVLNSGEFGFETDTGLVKLGNGTTTWGSLSYTCDPAGSAAAAQAASEAFTTSLVASVLVSYVAYSGLTGDLPLDGHSLVVANPGDALAHIHVGMGTRTLFGVDVNSNPYMQSNGVIFGFDSAGDLSCPMPANFGAAISGTDATFSGNVFAHQMTVSSSLTVSGDQIMDSGGTVAISFDGAGSTEFIGSSVTVDGTLVVQGNAIQDSGDSNCITFDGGGDTFITNQLICQGDSIADSGPTVAITFDGNGGTSVNNLTVGLGLTLVGNTIFDSNSNSCIVFDGNGGTTFNGASSITNNGEGIFSGVDTPYLFSSGTPVAQLNTRALLVQWTGITPATIDNSTNLPTTAFVHSAITAAVVGVWDDRGSYDASGNAFPSSGGSGTSGAILKGNLWTISVAGTLGGTAVKPGDTVRAIVDAPGTTAANWAIAEHGLGYNPANDTLGNLSNTSAARTNLGLGTAAVINVGSGVATALAIGTGSAGAVIVNGGVLGTPSSGNLANCTGLPVAGVVGAAPATNPTISGAIQDSANAYLLVGGGSSPTMYMASQFVFVFSSSFSYSGGLDLGFCRNSAGVLEVNNSTAGTFRDLLARSAILPTSTSVSTPASGRLTLWYDGTHLKATDSSGTVHTIF